MRRKWLFVRSDYMRLNDERVLCYIFTLEGSRYVEPRYFRTVAEFWAKENR